MKKKFKITVSYSSNFRIFNLFSKKKYNRINCKKFLLFIFFFNYLRHKNQFLDKITFFVKPKYFNIYTLLRAPYRYKLSRDQLTFSRYYILCSLNLKNFLNLKSFLNLTQIFLFLKFFKNIFPFFETNICFQKKMVMHCYFFLKTNFLFKTYKN